VSGTGKFASFAAKGATATNNGDGAVGVCVSTGTSTLCGQPGSPDGTVSICFFIQNLETSSLNPGAYTVTATGGDAGSPSGPIQGNADVETCDAKNGAWVPDYSTTVSGSVTLSNVTSSEVDGNADFELSSGDSLVETFHGVTNCN
jgi:hypothetical protein